jgi:hypothetical protein
MDKTRVEVRKSPGLAVLLAWLVPGLGHFYVGRIWKGAVFLVALVSCFFLGIGMHSVLFFPRATAAHSLFIATLGSLAQCMIGLPYFVVLSTCSWAGEIAHPLSEVGMVFALSAGLLNLLVMVDARDIALGRKE